MIAMGLPYLHQALLAAGPRGGLDERAVKHLRPVFGHLKPPEISADAIEAYLRRRLTQRVQVTTKAGLAAQGLVKPATVHQEYRILERMLNVAVRKKLIPANPCGGVEFPVRLKDCSGHYVSWSGQQQNEARAPAYLRDVIRIVVWIPASKTANGVAEVPLTHVAIEAFRDQIAIAGPGEWVFPSEKNPGRYQQSFRTAWRLTLRRARMQYFRIYGLRATIATRGRSGRRMGDATSAAGRREGL